MGLARPILEASALVCNIQSKAVFLPGVCLLESNARSKKAKDASDMNFPAFAT